MRTGYFGGIREEKERKYQELKDKRGSKEWNEYFLRYVPKELESKYQNKKDENEKNKYKKTHRKQKKSRKSRKTRKVKFFGAIKI